MRPPDELREARRGVPRRARVRARARRPRGGAALLARVGRQAHPAGALPRGRRGGRREPSRRRCPRPPRSSSCTRSRSSTTTCRRSTTTTSAAAGRARTSRSARASRCSPATRCSPRRSGSRSSYPTAGGRARARRGDARDDRRPVPRHHRRRRRPRGAAPAQDRPLFVGVGRLGLEVAAVPDGRAQPPWRAFGDELGLLFQVVDDILDGDGYAERLGARAARAGSPTESPDARASALDAIAADTSRARASSSTRSPSAPVEGSG